jgi:hypothetical protein
MSKFQFSWLPSLWRFVRVFLAGFIATFSVDFFAGSSDLKLQILQSAITGGIAALFKALRDKEIVSEKSLL